MSPLPDYRARRDDNLAETCAAAVKAEFTLFTAECAYDAAKAEWQRELWLCFGEPSLSLNSSLSLNYWDALAKGKPGSLLREKHTAYMAARKAYDDAGEEENSNSAAGRPLGQLKGTEPTRAATSVKANSEGVPVRSRARRPAPEFDDMPDDESCPDCDGLRGSCSWCQGAAIGDARRGDDW